MAVFVCARGARGQSFALRLLARVGREARRETLVDRVCSNAPLSTTDREHLRVEVIILQTTIDTLNRVIQLPKAMRDSGAKASGILRSLDEQQQ